MHDTQISDIVVTAFLNDHELAFPKFLVVGDLVVIVVTLSNFERLHVSLHSDHLVLQLLGVHVQELQLKLLLRNLSWGHFESFLGHIQLFTKFFFLQSHILKLVQLLQEEGGGLVVEDVVHFNRTLTNELKRLSPSSQLDLSFLNIIGELTNHFQHQL